MHLLHLLRCWLAVVFVKGSCGVLIIHFVLHHFTKPLKRAVNVYAMAIFKYKRHGLHNQLIVLIDGLPDSFSHQCPAVVLVFMKHYLLHFRSAYLLEMVSIKQLSPAVGSE